MLDEVNREFYWLDTTRTILKSTKDTYNNANSAYHVFLESDFSCITKTVTYEFIITKFNTSGWFGVGAGDMELINKNRPTWRYGQSAHGSYIVADNGWVGIHGNPKINNKLHSFRFGQGDVIQVTYDKTTRDLTFVKNPNKEDTATYTIADVPPTARPCTLLLFTDQIVTIKRP